MYLNYPNNPTGAVVPDGLFERAVEFARGTRSRGARRLLHGDDLRRLRRAELPRDAGAKEVGVEVFSLSKGWNMTGWRTAAIVGNAEAVSTYWKLKTNIDSGMFEAIQLATAAALRTGPPSEMSALPAPPRPRVRSARRDRRGRDAPKGHDLCLGAGSGGPHLGVVLRARAGGVGRGRLARRLVRRQRRGLLPHLAAVPDERLAEAVERLREASGWPVHYCGVVPMQSLLQLALIEEVRDPEPPVRLSALFYEQVGRAGRRGCGGSRMWSLGWHRARRRWRRRSDCRCSGRTTTGDAVPDEDGDKLKSVPIPIADGAYQRHRAVPRTRTRCSGRSRAAPAAKRHPYGIQLRIAELIGDRIADEAATSGTGRIEEIDALGARSRPPLRGRARVLDERRRPARDEPAPGVLDHGGLPPVERLNLPGSSP